ncbi:MAG TPA: glycosyltransferase 87 family protein [Vicinamibacteria bacterium]|nr:glycosyltransferase 87 family protein [Vicinamibacteria bacterium]
MTERAAHVVLGLCVLAMLAGVAAVRPPGFWGDGATYHSMAWSLAEDGDLRYEARDVFRVRREFPTGPQGLFLKRASGGLRWDPAGGFPWVRRVGSDQPRVYFAKAFTYPLVAAPLVALFGTRGLLLTNALALGAALVLAYRLLRRQASPGRALAAAAALVLATVAPLYLLWPAPELLTLFLVMAGLYGWRSGRPLLSAVALGLATYTKPYNLLLAIPLGLEPFLAAPREGWWPAWRESLRRGLAMATVVVGMFALNAAFTGEVNYQGGERKTFYGRFPEEVGPRGQKVTFGNSGFWMTTDQLGPAVEGEGKAAASARTGPPRSRREIEASFLRNLGYFWIGRFGGALPYYLPGVAALVAFLVAGPRSSAGWLAFAALVASWLFYIRIIPDNWYGGGGTVGNRYFLNLLPLAVLLLPRGRERVVAAGAVASAVFLWSIWLHPLHHSVRPGDHAMSRAFGAFPPELTMLNDLSVFTEAWRKKVPYGDTEGDPHKHWPADPRAYYLYFLDAGSWGKEARDGVEGFSIRGAERAEVVLRALEPVRLLRVRVTGGPVGDRVSVRVCGREQTVEVGAGQTREAVFEPGPGFPYYDTFLTRLALRSERGQSRPEDLRPVGAFVSIALEVDRRPPS